MKTIETKIFTIEELRPHDEERVMVWNDRFKQWDPQVYNHHNECWDDSEGDDYQRDLQNDDLWFSLPRVKTGVIIE